MAFTDDTKIKVANGEMLIRHINVGDKVICYNETADDVEEVAYIQTPTYQTTYAVMCVDDKNQKRVIYTTLDQQLLVYGGEYMAVGDMRIGTKLSSVGKVIAIVASGERKTYALQTTGNNKYYANGFIVQGIYAKE